MELNCRLLFILLVSAGLTTHVSAGEGVLQTLDCVINPKATVSLGSSQTGVLEDVLVDREDQVTAGQKVAALNMDVERLTAELAKVRAESDAALRSQQAQVEFRTRELARLETLTLEQSVAERIYDEALSERQLAELALEAARTEQNLAAVEYQRALAVLARRTIRSPVDGVVVGVAMAPGEYVYEQSVLMTIAQIDPLHVEVFMPVSQFGQISTGMRAIVMPEQPIGGEHPAVVTVVDSVFDAASRTFGVRLELPNRTHQLPAGLRCGVRFLPE